VSLPVLSADDARAITDRIRLAVEATWELIAEAYQREVWTSLGYGSWDDYCQREFGSARIKLPREERPDVVGSLREAGLSQRAIAAATGVAQSTVHEDLSSGDRNRSPDETDQEGDVSTVKGTDGRTYKAKRNPPGVTVRKAQELADSGQSREQIAEAVGVTKQHIGNLVNAGRLTVPADATNLKTHAHRSDRIVSESAIALEGVAMGLALADPSELGADQAAEWATSIRASVRTINKFVKEM